MTDDVHTCPYGCGRPVVHWILLDDSHTSGGHLMWGCDEHYPGDQREDLGSRSVSQLSLNDALTFQVMWT